MNQAHAATLPVQGALKGSPGTVPTDGNYVMIAALYDKVDAQKPVWQELEKQVVVSGGLFALDLGAVESIPDALLLAGQPLWFGLQVGGDNELPRVPLKFVPKAYFAQAAAKAATAEVAANAKQAENATNAEFAVKSNLAKQAEYAQLAELAQDLKCTGCIQPGALAAATSALFLSAKGGTVAGSVVVGGDLDIEGGLKVAKDAAIKGTLSAAGIVSTAGVAVSGNIAAGGGVKVGAQNANCAPDLAGTLRWTGKHLEVCTGDKWLQLDNAPVPQVLSVAPAVATVSGGTTLTVKGFNFSAGLSVQVGGVKATNVTVVSPTELQVVVPPQSSPGSKDLTVVAADGTQSTLAGAVAIELDGLAMWFDASHKDSWPGSGTAWNDLSGNGAHAKLLNGVVFNTLGSAPAMEFNGTGGGAQFPNAKLNTQKFMGVYWIWSQVPNADTNTGGLYVNRDSVTANAGDWVWFGKYSSDIWYFRVNNGSCCIDIGGSGGQSWSAKVPMGKWKMVHFGYEVGVANSWKWGVDGVNVASGTVASHPNSQSSSVSTIGWGHEGSGSYWKGGIAAARFYTRVLSDAELGAEFARTKGPFGL
ncbi:MAG: IPT/TIG domain-containing protein [Deltaproteobacteria bacterium]|nr:IPT/TIG domain-containing protein [Deltaproteobacteria bacterium]